MTPARPDGGALLTRSTAAPLGVAAGAVGALTFAGLVAPHGQTFYPPCPLHALTGIYCPGCGATRAVHVLATGHLLTALHDNALLVAAVPIVVVMWALWLVRTTGRQTPRLLPLTPRAARWLGVGLIVFAVARNIPFGPFRALAPLG